jgi:hypothetical protein
MHRMYQMYVVRTIVEISTIFLGYPRNTPGIPPEYPRNTPGIPRNTPEYPGIHGILYSTVITAAAAASAATVTHTHTHTHTHSKVPLSIRRQYVTLLTPIQLSRTTKHNTTQTQTQTQQVLVLVLANK